MVKLVFCVLMLGGSAFALPPAGTTRIQTGVNGREYYRDNAGRTLGQSIPNGTGRTYSDNRGVYARTQPMANGTRVIRVRGR